MLKFRESDTAEMETTLMTFVGGSDTKKQFLKLESLTDFDIIGQCSREIEEPENCKKQKE